MTDVTLSIGGKSHTIACRDGEQEQFRRLGALLDARWAAASRASGGLGGERAMLFVALMLADALEDAERRPATAAQGDLLERLAERLETLAGSLEN